MSEYFEYHNIFGHVFQMSFCAEKYHGKTTCPSLFWNIETLQPYESIESEQNGKKWRTA
jgi:hypothetical protein